MLVRHASAFNDATALYLLYMHQDNSAPTEFKVCMIKASTFQHEMHLQDQSPPVSDLSEDKYGPPPMPQELRSDFR